MLAKIGPSAAGDALSEYVPPVFVAMLLSVAGSYCLERSPTEMTRMFASSSASSASARLASLADVGAIGEQDDVVRSSPDSLARSETRTRAS